MKQFIRTTIGAVSLAVFALGASAQNARIAIDATKVLNKIPAKMYGSCIEDVNHEIYGGLYDQLLYGESFEEPAPTPNYDGWKTLNGEWKPTAAGIEVKPGSGDKLIRENPIVKNGSAEADIKFTGRGDNAGFIVRVNHEQAGLDDFDGYEISLNPDRQMVILGKHVHNWKMLKEVKVSFDRNSWTHLKVDMNNGQISVYVGNEHAAYLKNIDAPALTYTDTDHPLLSGKIGLRTFNLGAIFENFAIKKDGETIRSLFSGKPPVQVSRVWDAVTSPTARANFMLDGNDPYNSKQAQVIEILSGTGKIGVANKGLNRWGISVKRGEKFQGSVFFKADGLTGPVTVALQNAAGTKTYASTSFKSIASAWTKYPFTLTTNATDPKARFVIYIDKKGRLSIDQATLMNTGAAQFKGLPLRADIATKMQEEGLNFVRYGGTMVNAPDYKWKNMVGPRDKRPIYEGHWYSYTSNGFGINEFVAYSEAAGFDPAFAINVEETPQDVADMLEYLTGSATTTWGKKRAEAGHPAPYKLKYIELGNEEVIWGDLKNDYQHYAERFNLLYDVIHKNNPEIKVICAAWWRPKSLDNMEMVFKAINGRADYWDLHTWADDANSGTQVDHDLQNMRDMFLKWDPNTKLRITIFEENGGLHNLQRALGHATTMNAVRRHGDFVLTSCAANGLQGLGQNDNDWDQGQVFFTPSQVWGMPPFYATQMAAKNHEPLRVESNVDGDLDVTATRSESGDELVLHVVNTKSAAVATTISLSGFTGNGPVKVYSLAGDPKAENTPLHPTAVSTKESSIPRSGNTISYTFPGNSYTILRLKK
ncbi:alpha-L-arabinofuranosidase C-terminal domain-containing protein [Mucilaginibacter sp. dw_454]|uniref:alpha-L-arabinofuranosidase C-terminal domain-containing protein n=1 Tax=Mucilaginibacter sp. dw_454 TaxID=2720079 RepID=UPI001BD5ADF6|nr:alpha-L-arabinofuranosidase C-terminal domain-containing protein [Mucilaginibacter sp. dw_454]